MTDADASPGLRMRETDAGAMAPDIGSHVRRALGLALLFALVAGCAVVLWPFFVAILWGAILVVSTLPIFGRLVRLTGGRRSLAALLMTLGLTIVLLLPLVLVGARLTENVARLAEVVRSTMEGGLPPPPAWLSDVPVVGRRLLAWWQAAAQDAEALKAGLQDYVGPARDWLLARGADIAGGLLQLALSLLTAFFFYRDGPSILRTTDSIITKISGDRPGRFSQTAAATINGVVRGVLGTALAQALLSAIGYWLAGVPGALFLGLLSFFLSLVPLGLVLIWLPAAIWLASQGAKDWAVFTAVWGLFVGTLDNFLRPYLIRHGSDLPFLIVLLGVVGGAVGFGLVGVFLGPTLLAIAYSLAREWGGEPGAARSEPEPPTQSTVLDARSTTLP